MFQFDDPNSFTRSLTFGPSFRCLWFWTVQDTTQPEELLAGFTGLESSGSGTGLTSPAAPWDFCTEINMLHLCSSQYPTFTFSIMHLIPPPPPPPRQFSTTFVFISPGYYGCKSSQMLQQTSDYTCRSNDL